MIAPVAELAWASKHVNLQGVITSIEVVYAPGAGIKM